MLGASGRQQVGVSHRACRRHLLGTPGGMGARACGADQYPIVRFQLPPSPPQRGREVIKPRVRGVGRNPGPSNVVGVVLRDGVSGPVQIGRTRIVDFLRSVTTKWRMFYTFSPLSDSSRKFSFIPPLHLEDARYLIFVVMPSMVGGRPLLSENWQVTHF